MNTNNNNNTATRRPRLSYYHANARGTGAAVNFELHPATPEAEGHVLLEIAAQKPLTETANGASIYPSFGWREKIAVRLCMPDLCELLQVLRGYCESIADGRGLFHRTTKANIKIAFWHMIDPVSGYVLDVYTKPHDGEERHASIVFSPSEAVGLCCAIEMSMGLVAFGVPQI